MSYFKSLQIWNRLKRQLRSLVIRIGMNKPIDWKYEFDEFINILEQIADVRNKMQQPSASEKTEPEFNKIDSPYDNLVPKQIRDKQ